MSKQSLGWIPFARQLKSPHCNDRPEKVIIDLLVIHSISLPPGQFSGSAVERFFLGKLQPHEHPYFLEIASLKVSAHFFIRRNGSLIQFVPWQLRAWHAGVSNFEGREQCNDFSIGIELEGSDVKPYTQRQYQKLRRLIRTLMKLLPIRVLAGHSDIAPSRKTDPGPYFNWKELESLGLHRFQYINSQQSQT